MSITVEMRDEITGEIITRVIDRSNLAVHDGHIATTFEEQQELLNQWIAQHETNLTLVYWHMGDSLLTPH